MIPFDWYESGEKIAISIFFFLEQKTGSGKKLID